MSLTQTTKKMKTAFCVLAYRFGGNEYTFPIGIFGDETTARQAAAKHRAYRGGKYDHRIFEFEVDAWDDDLGHHVTNNPCIEKIPKEQVVEVVVKKWGKDFASEGGALTLPVASVTDDETLDHGLHTKTHATGWTITGEIREDYYTWVSDFDARHPKFGKVWGNFESEVHADSEEGFEHFFKHHTPVAWDYGDI